MARSSVFICILALISSAAEAQAAAPPEITDAGSASPITAHVIADGQFVYGPNVGDFDVRRYLQEKAPQLLEHADELYGRAQYYSINPKVYITLLEMQSQLISAPDARRDANPFGLDNGDFLWQLDRVSEILFNAYYLHLNSYAPVPVAKRSLPAMRARNGDSVQAAPDTNAGTYAIMAGLASLQSSSGVEAALDSSQSTSFYQTYRHLFADDPRNEQNHIYIQGEAGYLAAPPDLLQLPYPRGVSWKFGGVHNWGVQDSGFTDASSIDFMPGSVAWGDDTSNMWVVAAASGVPTKVSSCWFKIARADGWGTGYYHLENIQTFTGWINQNDRIGVIANTEAEAICNGGSSTGPHVHFGLMRNGAFVAINGTALSGWAVHSGRYPYDTDNNYMWLERAGIKKFAWQSLLNDFLPAVGSGIYDDQDAAWTYGGTWGAPSIPGAYNDSLHIAVTRGSTASLHFNGNGFVLTYLAYPNWGRVGIYLDGSETPLTTLDTNAAAGLPTYTSPKLSPGAHTVTFKHDGPATAMIGIDSIQVMAPAYLPAGTYDDGDAAWDYSGTWGAPAVSGAFNNTLHIAVAQGSSAAFYFNGSGLTLTYLTYPGWGQIGVYLDGSATPLITLNTNAPAGLPIYAATGLSPGNHTVVFEHDGPPSAYVAIDKLVIEP